MTQHAQPSATLPAAPTLLTELSRALDHESRIVEELRDTLIRQREAVASTSADAVNATVDAVGRILMTLDEARRRRAVIVGALTGDPATRLDRLEATVPEVPAELAESRRKWREAAATVAREVTINRGVLRRALESGDAFLQALFSTTATGTPVYGTRERDESPPGVLLNRRA